MSAMLLTLPRYPGCVVAVLLLLAACHDAPRKNPFDPELTPAVELTVALDDTAGTATLTWTRYAGETEFAEYRVLRNVVENTWVDTLTVIEEVGQTAFLDSLLAPDTAYDYRVAAVNVAGFAVSSEVRGVAGYSVEEVRLLPVESDVQAGALVLRWSRFRDPGFVAYQVRRRLGKLIQEDVLATLKGVGDTTFVDSTALIGVDYVYTVDVHAVGEVLPSNSQIHRLILPEVVLSEPVFDSATASAHLEWSEYDGPRFAAYRVERRTAGQEWQTVDEIADRTVAALTDSNMMGNTEYFYRVVVVTEREEEVPSAEMSGRFHSPLAEWPLEMEEEGYVRLYVEEEGRITALVADRRQVRLFFFSEDGFLLEEQLLVDIALDAIEPFSVSTALLSDGRRLLGLAVQDVAMVAEFTETGKQIQERRQLFADEKADVFEGMVLPGTIRISAQPEQVNVFRGSFLTFDNVGIFAGEEELFLDDFENGDLAKWKPIKGGKATRGQLVTSITEFSNYSVNFFKAEDAWQNYHLEADVRLLSPSILTFSLGARGAENIWMILRLTTHRNLAIMDLEGGLEAQSLSEDLQDFPGFIPVLYHQLEIGMIDGRIRAFLETPVLFGKIILDKSPSLMCLAASEDRVALAVENQPFFLNSERIDSNPNLLEAPAGELRMWEWEETSLIGICLPELQLVAFDRTGVFRPTGQLIWPFTTLKFVTILGTGAGQEAGEFLFPLSFDAGADGRLFVLDAGNARIQVFDQDGNYITQWGRKGSGAGEFDFGSGRRVEDFAGSIAVDDDGYIYVADVGNRRIQKFAP